MPNRSGIARRAILLGTVVLALSAVPALAQTKPGQTRPVAAKAPVLLVPYQLIEPLKEILAETAPKRPVSLQAASAGEIMARLETDAGVDLVITDDPDQRRQLLEAERLDLASEQVFARDRIVLIARSERATPIRLRPGVNLVVPLEGNLIGMVGGTSDTLARLTPQFLDSLRLDAPSVALVQSFPSMADLASALDDGQIPAAFGPASLLTHRPHLELSGTAPAELEVTLRYTLDIVAGRDRPETRALRDALTGPLAVSLLTRTGLLRP
ncbi:MAG: substrate-binding domain-containing protein [Elstera sp.]